MSSARRRPAGRSRRIACSQSCFWPGDAGDGLHRDMFGVHRDLRARQHSGRVRARNRARSSQPSGVGWSAVSSKSATGWIGSIARIRVGERRRGRSRPGSARSARYRPRCAAFRRRTAAASIATASGTTIWSITRAPSTSCPAAESAREPGRFRGRVARQDDLQPVDLHRGPVFAGEEQRAFHRGFRACARPRTSAPQAAASATTATTASTATDRKP